MSYDKILRTDKISAEVLLQARALGAYVYCKTPFGDYWRALVGRGACPAAVSIDPREIKMVPLSRNKQQGRYQGAVTRFGNKWGDYRPNREGNRNGKRHIRSTVIPEEPMCNAFKDAKPVSTGAALNVLSARYKASKPIVQIGLGVDQYVQQLIEEMNSDVSTVRS